MIYWRVEWWRVVVSVFTLLCTASRSSAADVGLALVCCVQNVRTYESRQSGSAARGLVEFDVLTYLIMRNNVLGAKSGGECFTSVNLMLRGLRLPLDVYT